MVRGDVYQAVLDPVEGSEQGGTRPVVVVSRDAINRSSSVVVVVPLTGRENKSRLYPSHVEIRAEEGGLQKDSVVLCEQVRSIGTHRLKKNIGHLPNQRIARINAALKIALDLDNS